MSRAKWSGTSLEEKLFACLAWADKHDAELVFSSGGVVALFDEDGNPIAEEEGFTFEAGARVLAVLLDGAEVYGKSATTRPAVPPVEFTYLGLGENRFDWEERRIITVTPQRELEPRKLLMPSTCHGYLLFQMWYGEHELLSNTNGVPIEFFSEVMTAPQLLYPVIGPSAPVKLDLRAPAAPKAPPPFSGAVYGLQK